MPGGTPLLPVEAYSSREWFDRKQKQITDRAEHLATFYRISRECFSAIRI